MSAKGLDLRYRSHRHSWHTKLMRNPAKVSSKFRVVSIALKQGQKRHWRGDETGLALFQDRMVLHHPQLALLIPTELSGLGNTQSRRNRGKLRHHRWLA